MLLNIMYPSRLDAAFKVYNKHWTKTYIPTTLGIHWVCIGNVLNPAN